MVAVESLYLLALLSAFVGLIALLVLAGPETACTARSNNLLTGVILAAAIVSVGSFFLYALSPHTVARSVYSATLAGPTQI